MKKQLSILLLIFTFTMSANAQLARLTRKKNMWRKGEILTTIGTKTGLLQAPLYVNSKTVHFKASENAEEEEIDKSLIIEVRILNSKGGFTVLENLKVNRYLSEHAKDQVKLLKKTLFVLKLAEGYYSAYVTPSQGYYRVNENGSISMLDANSYIKTGALAFNFYIKKQGDDYMNYMYNSSFFNSKKRKCLVAWLGDSEAVMEKLEDRRFLKHASLDAWVNLYNQDKQR